jgi:hypothetical protein
MSQGFGSILALSALWPVALGVYPRYNAGVCGGALGSRQCNGDAEYDGLLRMINRGVWRLNTRGQHRNKSMVTQNGIAKSLLWAFCVLVKDPEKSRCHWDYMGSPGRIIHPFDDQPLRINNPLG